MVIKHFLSTIIILLFLVHSGNSQTYNPQLNITTKSKDIANDGFVEYTTTNAAINDARFTLFGDGYFDLQNKFDHQFAKHTSGFSTKTHFLQRYKKKGPIIRSKITGKTGAGSSTNNKISMPTNAKTRVGSSWMPSKTIENYFVFVFENTSTATDTGCVEFYYDDTELSLNANGILDYGWVKYKSKTKVTGSSLYTHKLTWDFETLTPGEQRVIYIPMTSLKNAGTKINLGSKYDSGCNGNGNGGGGGEISNSVFLSSGYPHDPNIKVPDKTCIRPYHPDRQMITYMIRFQNEGTAEAVDVILKDNLDGAYLDVTTLNFIDSEYSYTYTLTGNLLEITFSGIHLPGLQQPGPKTYSYDETESYIIFEICTHPNLNPGTIYNQAEIIFDTQPPIHTNKSAVSVVMECQEPIEICTYGSKPTSTSESIAHDITIHPNPVSDLITVDGLAGQEATIMIINNRGEVVKSLFRIGGENSFVDMSDLVNGLYFIQIRNDFLNITKKVIKI